MEQPEKAIMTLPEIEKNFRFMANMIPDILWTALPDGYEDFHNSRFSEFTGLKPIESEGFGWQRFLHPDDMDRTLKTWKSCLAKGEPYEIEYRLKKADGEYTWFLVRAIPWKDENGNIIKWFGTSTDIHIAKQANIELNRIVGILNHFVYIAAHDLRSPVNNMKMILEFMKNEETPEKKGVYIHLIDQSLQRLDITINGLVEVVEAENLEKQARNISFEEAVQEAISDLSLIYPKLEEHVITDFTHCPTVNYVHSYLISIFKNLLSNAYKYQSKNRPLKIKVSSEKQDEFVKLVIADNGKGINMETAGDLFRPFKRLSSEGEGTGIGLYVIKNIVERNGGSIEYHSKANEGTNFILHLKEY